MPDKIELDNIPIVGDLQKGRPTLGRTVSVSVYRLVLYSLKAALAAELGKDKAKQIVYLGGKLAGNTLYKNFLQNITDETEFFERLAHLLMKFKMSKFSVQKLDRRNKQFVFGIKEDLDCSGLPPDGETKCDFDEGMISGILSGFYGGEFFTRETGCWGTGDRSCFFKSVPLEK